MEVIRQAKPADSDAIRALYGAIHEAMKTTGEPFCIPCETMYVWDPQTHIDLGMSQLLF